MFSCDRIACGAFATIFGAPWKAKADAQKESLGRDRNSVTDLTPGTLRFESAAAPPQGRESDLSLAGPPSVWFWFAHIAIAGRVTWGYHGVQPFT